jgi:hypothetical protein
MVVPAQFYTELTPVTGLRSAVKVEKNGQRRRGARRDGQRKSVGQHQGTVITGDRGPPPRPMISELSACLIKSHSTRAQYPTRPRLRGQLTIVFQKPSQPLLCKLLNLRGRKMTNWLFRRHSILERVLSKL